MPAPRMLRFAAAVAAAAQLASAQTAQPDNFAGARRAPEHRWAPLQQMTSGEREQWLHAQGPQQRREPWMRMSPDERHAMRERMTPEERDALRERWMEERRRRMEDGGAPRMHEGMPHRLTPEQRQQLRDQIRESHRDWRGKGMHGPRGER